MPAHRKERPDASRFRGNWVLIALAGFFAIGLAAIWLVASGPGADDTSRLVGRWRRADGDYVLEIRKAPGSGPLDAAYFNPRPINVAKAESRIQEGKLHVSVELRDQGYPGSTYTLAYNRERDELEGVYVSPELQQSFDVLFTRE